MKSIILCCQIGLSGVQNIFHLCTRLSLWSSDRVEAAELELQRIQSNLSVL